MTPRRLLLSTFAPLAMLAASGSADAIQIFGYTSARHDRFEPSSYPGSPVRNSNLLGGGAYAGFDYSGLGWATLTDPYTGVTYPAATLISPQHVLVARHFPPGNSLSDPAQVRFLSIGGVMRSYTVSAWSQLSYNGRPSDLLLGTLSAPIAASDGVGFLPVVSAGPFSAGRIQASDLPKLNLYVGRELLVVGRTTVNLPPAIGRNRVSGFEEADLFQQGAIDNLFTIFDFDPLGPNGFAPDEALLTSGDSGSALLMPFDGQLTLLGTHSDVYLDRSPEASASTFVPFYIDQLNALMAPTGFQVTVIAIPEPGTMALAASAGLAGLAWRSRRRFRNCPPDA